MNSPTPGVDRGPLVGHWSGRRWHNIPLPGSWSGTRGGVIYGRQPITAPDRRAPTMSLRYGWVQRLPGSQILAQSTGLLSQRTFDPLLGCRLVLFQTLADRLNPPQATRLQPLPTLRVWARQAGSNGHPGRLRPAVKFGEESRNNSPNTSMLKGLSYGRKAVHGTLEGTKEPFRRNPTGSSISGRDASAGRCPIDR